MLYAYRNFQRAVRKGDWKLIEYSVKDLKTIQLFNLNKDPFERDNLAQNPKYLSKLMEMRRLLEKERKANLDI
jgi:arylsulfatase A-like enzyme